MSVTLIGGGVRSGKSAFAVELARRHGGPAIFLATAEPSDDEMRERIARHRRERGGDFTTVEEAVAVPEALARIGARAQGPRPIVVLDSLTSWLGTLVVRGAPADAILARVDALIATVVAQPLDVVVVSSEVGMGVVADAPLARVFVDVAGAAHRRVAGVADALYLAALGTILRLRPTPIEVVA